MAFDSDREFGPHLEARAHRRRSTSSSTQYVRDVLRLLNVHGVRLMRHAAAAARDPCDKPHCNPSIQFCHVATQRAVKMAKTPSKKGGKSTKKGELAKVRGLAVRRGAVKAALPDAQSQNSG